MIQKASREFLQTALTNNSFDVAATNNALRMAVDHSFSYLYRLQRNTVCYEEYFYTTQNNMGEPDYGDLFLDKENHVCANFPVSLILPGKREAFRNSNYYKKKFSYVELHKVSALFARLPVITIDDQVVKEFQIEVFDDFFRVTFPFDRSFLYTKQYVNSEKHYEYIEHRMTLQIVANSFFMDFVSNAAMIRMNSYDGTSFDRIQKSYIQNAGISLDTDKPGTFFAVLFFGKDKLGTNLQDVVVDEAGDYHIYYDTQTLARLRSSSGDVTIRFLFYRDLYPYRSYRYQYYPVSEMVPVRKISEEVSSEIFLLRKDDDSLYEVPIPTENLFLLNTKWYNHVDVNPVCRTQIPNTSAKLAYPNIYTITDNVENGDMIRVFYFYVKPYDLSYKYMYDFYYKYLTYKWKNLSLEKTINKIYFGETVDSSEEMKHVVALRFTEQFLKEGKITKAEKISMYLFMIDALGNQGTSNPENLLNSFRLHPPEVPEGATIDPWASDFLEVFHYVIEHEIVPYHYDEHDYAKNFQNKLTPLEYKVQRLKEFMRDDPEVLHNYLLAQNTVGCKYEFSSDEIDLKSRIRTKLEGSDTELPEPMYIFPVSKVDPNTPLAARIYVNGLIVINFVYDRYEYTDYIYIPVKDVPDDAYFEIEVFPCLTQTEHLVFTEDNQKSAIVEFKSSTDVAPTLSDLFFFLGTKDTNERLPLRKFRLELVDTRYNYYTGNNKVIVVYKPAKNGVIENGVYYTERGECYTFEGNRKESGDISESEIQRRLDDGTLVEDVTYETSNLMKIIRDTDYVSYDRVALGESIINPDNKGMNCTFLTRVKVTLLDDALLNQTITLRIAKKPGFYGKVITDTSYPLFIVPIENLELMEDYTRAFKNGRLISKNRYDYMTKDGFLYVQTLERMEPGESFALDVTPYRNRLIFYRAKIDSDRINLRGIINKPFDTRYYEVYLNGRRLNRTNIHPISPYEILITGAHSECNLEIYEKDRDWEYYGLDFDDYFTLSDFIRKVFMEEYISKELIKDEIIKDEEITEEDLKPNDTTEDEEPWDREKDIKTIYFEIFYYMRLIPQEFVTPDKDQFNTKDIKETFGVIDELYHVKDDEGGDVLLLSADRYYDGESENQWTVYRMNNDTGEDQSE